MRVRQIAVVCAICCTSLLHGQLKTIKPGFNFFSTEQDIQLGKEAAAQVEKQMPVIHNQQVEDYLNALGHKLAQSPRAGKFPFAFHLIYDKNINAFALPGGPVFVNTGLITSAENEAQLAGVLAHEMSHVALRHGTHKASKQNLIAIPAALAGARPNASLTAFEGNSYALRYPQNWHAYGDRNAASVTIAPDSGLVRGQNG